MNITSENTLREFPIVIATVDKVSRKRGLWLVVRVNTNPPLTSAVCPEIRVCGQEWEGDFVSQEIPMELPVKQKGTACLRCALARR